MAATSSAKCDGTDATGLRVFLPDPSTVFLYLSLFQFPPSSFYHLHQVDGSSTSCSRLAARPRPCLHLIVLFFPVPSITLLFLVFVSTASRLHCTGINHPYTVRVPQSISTTDNPHLIRRKFKKPYTTGATRVLSGIISIITTSLLHPCIWLLRCPVLRRRTTISSIRIRLAFFGLPICTFGEGLSIYTWETDDANTHQILCLLQQLHTPNLLTLNLGILHVVYLSHYCSIRVNGEDHIPFLHKQSIANFEALSKGGASLSRRKCSFLFQLLSVSPPPLVYASIQLLLLQFTANDHTAAISFVWETGQTGVATGAPNMGDAQQKQIIDAKEVKVGLSTKNAHKFCPCCNERIML
ncbi:unnamed protein product [Lactuca virosa]|uniref:Uncharacterized protein n=1 Tax=Lactuca virosa TaxID=75947 RepID=A0AAU9NZ25_9ASTR|nr:unnamed protein product [Lactuca virosa]